MTRQEALSIPRIRERSILRNVYIWMTIGLAITGLVALWVSTNHQILQTIATNAMLFYGLIIGQLVLVFYLSANINRMSIPAATFAYGLYALSNGFVFGVIFAIYGLANVTNAFFVTSLTFAGMSLYALTTKRDLSGLGTYLFMGLWGLIIASIVNFFLRSEALYYLTSYVGVAIFLGLTAYDTQKIKNWNNAFGTQITEIEYVRLSIMGALKLYLDFINLFLFMLRIMGRRN